MLSNNALQDFKKIWKEEYGEDIPNDFAVEEAIALLTLFNAVYKPIKKDWLNEYDNKQNRRHLEQEKVAT